MVKIEKELSPVLLSAGGELLFWDSATKSEIL